MKCKAPFSVAFALHIVFFSWFCLEVWVLAGMCEQGCVGGGSHDGCSCLALNYFRCFVTSMCQLFMLKFFDKYWVFQCCNRGNRMFLQFFHYDVTDTVPYAVVPCRTLWPASVRFTCLKYRQRVVKSRNLMSNTHLHICCKSCIPSQIAETLEILMTDSHAWPVRVHSLPFSLLIESKFFFREVVWF